MVSNRNVPSVWLIVDEGEESTQAVGLMQRWSRQHNWPLEIYPIGQVPDCGQVPTAVCIGRYEGLGSIQALAASDPSTLFGQNPSLEKG